MIRIKIEHNIAQNVRLQVQSRWNLKGKYWYPLAPYPLSDVIAFDTSYINTTDKLIFLMTLICEHGDNNLYELQERGDAYVINDFLPIDYQNMLWRSDKYYDFFNEGIWCSDQSDWIIYYSHEETVTVGGQWLIDRLKIAWSDWKANISWDTKNKDC